MTDPRVDAYIQNAPAFAQPILTELRRRLHAAVPTLEETIKWNSPFFLVEGRILASVAAFKAHAKFLLFPEGMSVKTAPESVDLASVEDLPAEKTFVQRLKAVAAKTAERAGKAKPAAKKAPAAKKPAARKPAARKPAVKKPAARKPAPKKLSAAKKKR